MAGLTVPVNAPGLSQTSSEFDRLDASASKGARAMIGASAGAEKMSKSMEVLNNKLQNGAVIRNATASIALLTSGSGDATDKLTGLAASLASIPGPVGLIAAAMTANLIIFKSFRDNARESVTEVENLKAALEKLASTRTAGLEAISDRISGAAAKVGMSIRSSTAAGATQADINRVGEISGGDSNKQLGIAGQLGESGLSNDAKEEVVKVLEAVYNTGREITQELAAKAISASKDAAANRTIDATGIEGITADARAQATRRGGGSFVGGGYNENGLREGNTRTDQIVDLINPSSADRSKTLDRLNRSMSQSAMAEQAALRAAEQPGIAESRRTITDATRGLESVTQEALTKATMNAVSSTDTLVKTIDNLDKTIKETTAKRNEASTKAYSGWRSFFNGDEPPTSP